MNQPRDNKGKWTKETKAIKGGQMKVRIEKTVSEKGSVDWKIYVDGEEKKKNDELSRKLTGTTYEKFDGIFDHNHQTELEYGNYKIIVPVVDFTDQSAAEVTNQIQKINKTCTDFIENCKKQAKTESIEFNL